MRSWSLLSLPVAMVLVSGCRDTKPLVLDLSRHYQQQFKAPEQDKSAFGSIAGSRMFDGVPFHVDGRAFLYGKQVATDAGASREQYPDFIGIKVDRSFDELHLLHTTQWPDAEGMTIARVRLNYADGTKHELDIGYGVHVRDGQRLQSEELEAVTDANTKVVWRGPGVANFKSSRRIFKSVLMNPFPAKRVETLDFVSTGQTATYDVYAATVVNSDPKRPVTPPVPQDRPERNFDGRLSVRIVDNENHPIEGAWVDSSLSIPGSGWATSGAPFFTSASGMGVVKYPTDGTDLILLGVSKEGWRAAQKWLSVTGDRAPAADAVITLQLSPESIPTESD